MRDLIIIGAGPAGLSAAVYANRAGLDVLVLEQNAMSGGQVLNTYEVDNYLGLPDINGFDMGMKFKAHADSLGVEIQSAKVLEIRNPGDKKVIHTRRKDFETKTVIVATGARHAGLNVPGEEKLAGRGVSYCATCDGAFYKDRTVAVIGGGNVALEDAVYLAKLCKKVYLIHRRDEFRATKTLQEKLKALSNVETCFSTQVMEIRGEDMVTSILVQTTSEDARDSEPATDTSKNSEREIAVDGVFVAVGILPDTDLLKGLVDLDEKGYVIAGEDCKTSEKGIYVAGDIRKKPLRQIVTAVADGANAAVSANAQISAWTAADGSIQR